MALNDTVQATSMSELNFLWLALAFELMPLIAPAQDASTSSVITTKVRADPGHPLRIGENYPAMSRRLHEEGTCKVKLTVTADGAVRDVSLTLSTGYPRLDQACLDTFIHGGLLPASVDGAPVTTTVEIPTTWKLGPTPPR